MLDRFHWQKEEEFFLGIVETGEFSIQDVRELTWLKVKDSFEGLMIAGKHLPLRDHVSQGLKEMLQSGIGLYGESISGRDAIGTIFSKHTLKEVTKELDQFKDV